MMQAVMIRVPVETWTCLHAGDDDFLTHARMASDAELEDAIGVLRARQAADGGQYMRYAAVRAEQRRRGAHGKPKRAG